VGAEGRRRRGERRPRVAHRAVDVRRSHRATTEAELRQLPVDLEEAERRTVASVHRYRHECSFTGRVSDVVHTRDRCAAVSRSDRVLGDRCRGGSACRGSPSERFAQERRCRQRIPVAHRRARAPASRRHDASRLRRRRTDQRVVCCEHRDAHGDDDDGGSGCVRGSGLRLWQVRSDGPPGAARCVRSYLVPRRKR
jgi:hypothetical protein